MLQILHIGRAETFTELEAHLPGDALLVSAQTLNDALAHYINFIPALVVIEHDEAFARDAWCHIRTVNGPSPHGLEGVLVVGAEGPPTTPTGAIVTHIAPGEHCTAQIAVALRQLEAARRALLAEWHGVTPSEVA